MTTTLESLEVEFVYCENDEENTYLNLFPNIQLRIPENSSWNTPIFIGDTDSVLPFCNISIIIDRQEYYPTNITNSKNSVTFKLSDTETISFQDNIVTFNGNPIETIVTFVLLIPTFEGA